MRKKAILFCMLFGVLTDAVAQTGPHETVWAVVAAGSTQNNTYVAIGQPFYEQIVSGGYELAYSVAQAQLMTEEITDETCDNQPYTQNNFNISVDELSEGVKKYEQYVVNVDTLYNYDLIKRLTLTVWPTYEVYDTVMFHGDFPAGINEGANNLDLATVHSCDSVVHLYAMICPFTVTDGSNITYPTLVLDRYCWTQRNSQATVYDDGNATPVARALVYQSNRHPDVAANESVYGRLYTWRSAAGIAEGSPETAAAADENGFVQGICPVGWHLPAAPEVAALNAHSAFTVKSETLWLNDPGDNSTDFTLLPSGKYNASSGRFEGLLTEGSIWLAAGTLTPDKPALLGYSYYCDSPVPSTMFAGNAYSVRCVKNY
ncbi:MAG: FISUMP domain-containing protein [Bacteroidales bacterium]|nr:FISUMP domain-containing protein [Bacteroidales bacterium]